MLVRGDRRGPIVSARHGASGSPRRSWLQAIIDALFGYDFFISYAWVDGRAYALALERELRARGFQCFLDSSEYARGDDWRAVGRRAIRKTAQLVLVGTPEALASEPVLREVEAFAHSRRRIVPVSFGDSLFPAERTARLFEHLAPSILAIREAPDRMASGPSEAALGDLQRGFTLLRQTQKRVRWLASASLVFALLAALATVLSVVAEQRRQVAHARALAAQSRNELSRAQDLALLLAAEADEVRSTDETRSSLLHAIASAPTELFLHPTGTATSAVAALPGDAIVTSDWQGHVTLWDLRGRRAVQVVRASDREIFALALAPDASQIAVGGADGFVRRLSPDGGLRVLGEHPIKGAGAVRALVFTDARRMVVSADQTVLGLLDIETGVIAPISGGHTSPPSALVVDRSTSTLVSAGGDHRLVFWKLQDGRPSEPEVVPVSVTVTSLALSPDGKWLALGTHDHGLEIWKRNERVAVKKLGDGAVEGRVLAATFSPDSKLLVWGGDDGSVHRFRIPELREDSIRVHSDALLALGFDGEGRRLFSAGRDGKIWIGRMDSDFPHMDDGASLERANFVTALARVGQGSTCVLGGEDGELLVVDLVTGSTSTPLPTHGGRVQSLLHVPGDEVVVSLGADAKVRAFRVANDALTPLGEPLDAVAPGRLLPWRDGELLVLGADGSVRIGKPGGPMAQRNLPLPADQRLQANGPLVASTDPERGLLATVTTAFELWVFPLDRGGGIRLDKADVSDLAFAPSGLLYVATLGGLKAWDVDTGTLRFSLSTGPRAISRMALVPQADLLLLTNSYHEISFWSLLGREQLSPWIALPGDDIVDPMLAPDAARVHVATRKYQQAEGRNRYRFHRFSTSTEAWRALARRIANRELTQAERGWFDL